MADAFFDVFWWIVIAVFGIGIGTWFNRQVSFGTSRLVAVPARALVLMASLLLSTLIVLVFIELLIVALY